MSTAFLLSRLLSLKSDYNFYALQETLLANKQSSYTAQVSANEARQEAWQDNYDDVMDAAEDEDATTFIINGVSTPISTKTTGDVAALATQYANSVNGDIEALADELAELSELDTLYQVEQTFYDTEMTETKSFMDSLKSLLQQSASDVPGGGGS